MSIYNKNIAIGAFIAFFGVIGNTNAQKAFEMELGTVTSVLQDKKVVTCSDGGFAVKEVFHKDIYGLGSIRVTRFNSSHQLLWSRNFDNESLDSVQCAPGYGPVVGSSREGASQVCASGSNIYVVYSTGGVSNNMIILLLNQNGNLLWHRKFYIGKRNCYLANVCLGCTSQGKVCIAGHVDSVECGPAEPFVNTGFMLMLDSQGNMVFNKKYFCPFFYFTGINFDRNGNIYVCESSYLLVFDELGIPKKQIVIQDYPALHPLHTFVDSNGYIYVGGDSVSQNNQISNFAAKISPQGETLWCHVFDEADYNNSDLGDFTFTEHDGLFIRHFVGDQTATDSSHLIAIDTNGAIKWARSFILPVFGTFPLTSYSNNAESYWAYFVHNVGYGKGLLSVDPYGTNWRTRVSFVDSLGNMGCVASTLSVGYRNAKLDCGYYQPSDEGVPFRLGDSAIDISWERIKKLVTCEDPTYPEVELPNDTIVCIGKILKIKNIYPFRLGFKYLWNTGDTLDSLTVTQSGRYWLYMKNSLYTSTDTVTIVFRDQIKTGLSKKLSICPYDSVLLSVKDTIASYYWITPSKKTVSGRSVMAKDSGNYYLMLNNTKACTAVDTVHIAWYPLPQATAGPDTLLCHNQSYTMRGAGGTVYDWIPATYLSSATDPHAKAILPNKQQYILVVSNTQGCRDTSQVLLNVRPPLQIKAHADNATVCFGKAVLLSAAAHGGDSLQWAYNWVNDAAKTDTLTIRPTQSGWHKIALSDNCTPLNATDSVYITVVPRPQAAFQSIPGNPVKSHEPISFLNQSLNASSYLWTFGDTGKSSEASPKYIYTDTGRYKVALVAYGQNNCPNDTAYGYIQVIDGTVAIYIPNAFTPNRDGKNETFAISGTGIQSYSYQIYNRWGELLYSTPWAPSTGSGTQGSNGWDGTFKGQTVPEGVYIYQFTITDIDGYFHYLSGNVTVLK